MAKKDWLAGIAIGAGAALGARELVARMRSNKRTAHMYRGDGPELEPEDSRSESHVPNAREESRDRSAVSGDWVRTVERASRPRESRDAEWARQAAERSSSNSAAPSTRHTNSPVPQPNASTGRTVTPTESELRRSPLGPSGPVGQPGTTTPAGTVDYSNPKAQPAQGGEAPFIQKENG